MHCQRPKCTLPSRPKGEISWITLDKAGCFNHLRPPHPWSLSSRRGCWRFSRYDAWLVGGLGKMLFLKFQSLYYTPLVPFSLRRRVRDEVIKWWCNHLTLYPSPRAQWGRLQCLNRLSVPHGHSHFKMCHRSKNSLLTASSNRTPKPQNNLRSLCAIPQCRKEIGQKPALCADKGHQLFKKHGQKRRLNRRSPERCWQICA